jgi:hypothetical protein
MCFSGLHVSAQSAWVADEAMGPGQVWAATHGLNDASAGTFNSFALSLMVGPPAVATCILHLSSHSRRACVLWDED